MLGTEVPCIQNVYLMNFQILFCRKQKFEVYGIAESEWRYSAMHEDKE